MSLEAGKFKQLVIENTLRGCQLFAGLPPADIASVASFLVPKQFKKGEYLFRWGDPTAGFYIVQNGAVNVHRVSAGGKEQVIHVFRPIETFAEASLPEGRYLVDARAIMPTTVLLVPRNDFVDLLGKRPELALRMFASMSQHLRVLVGLLEDLTLKDIETRLANWLLKHCPPSKTNGAIEIKLDSTKRVLAAEMGTTSETLSRTLAKFRDQKLIRVAGRNIVITQPRKLEALLRQHLGES